MAQALSSSSALVAKMAACKVTCTRSGGSAPVALAGFSGRQVATSTTATRQATALLASRRVAVAATRAVNPVFAMRAVEGEAEAKLNGVRGSPLKVRARCSVAPPCVPPGTRRWRGDGPEEGPRADNVLVLLRMWPATGWAQIGRLSGAGRAPSSARRGRVLAELRALGAGRGAVRLKPEPSLGMTCLLPRSWLAGPPRRRPDPRPLLRGGPDDPRVHALPRVRQRAQGPVLRRRQR
mmetsp:Transcript_58029/g.184396  ORF Transcript_58029/g.184396 Transcript_58029/m.184396 type:complete len:237 (+) Transcript_58029:176-886(+)